MKPAGPLHIQIDKYVMLMPEEKFAGIIEGFNGVAGR
jgi:hypothetical protein